MQYWPDMYTYGVHPCNTAEPPCPLQVIQRIILYPKLHFIIFSYMMSAFALLIFYLSSAMP